MSNQGSSLRRRDALRLIAATVPAVLIGSSAARAADTIKVAIGQRGNWENSLCELGQNAGIFRKHGLELDILYTDGSGQTQQAVISGSIDIGVGVGLYSTLGAFSKGAPVRIIGSGIIGAHDLYWYVPAASPIKTMRDAAGKTVAYSTNGSSTNVVVLGLQKMLGVKFKPTATGAPPVTFTQVMSGQIDVGFSSPPFAVEAVEQGRIRIVARGSDVPEFGSQSVRVTVANAAFLQTRPDAVVRFMAAYRETLVWLYTDAAAIPAYSAWASTTPELATKVRDQFYPRANLEPDQIKGLDAVMADAVTYRYLPAPLSADQVKSLIQIPPVR